MNEDVRDPRAYPLALNFVPGVGTVLYRRLIESFGTARMVFDADVATLSGVEGMSERAMETILNFRGSRRVKRELEIVDRTGVTILPFEDPAYPEALRAIYDPPPVLYVKGTVSLNHPSVAVVGTRKPTRYGIRMAGEIARGLALNGFTVVSGMAYGIDSAAHRGALEAGGKTVAVFGCGLDVVYPKSNRSLCERIIGNGAVVSEYPMGTMPHGGHFPERNRIISGLSLGVVVVEASEKSGSLITAFLGLNQNREVFAVPGAADSPYSRGTHRLIKEGAKLVETVDDVLEELPDPGQIDLEREDGKENKIGPELSDDERSVLEAVGEEPIHIDDVSRCTGVVINDINAILLQLELKGLVKQLRGKYFVR